MARDESELQRSRGVPGANVWILDVFTQFIIHVVFDAKGMRYAAESWPPQSALISPHVVENGEKRGNLCLASLIKRQRRAWLPASQSAQSRSGVHGDEQRR